METAYEHELTRIADSLVYKYDGSLSPDVVRAAVERARADLEPGSKVRTYLPVLIERQAEATLRRGMKDAGLHATKDVVFIDAHNSGRSQLAGALLQSHAHELIHVHTAGIKAPGQAIQPEVIEALREVGIDISRQLPAPINDDVLHVADVVVLLGVHPERIGMRAAQIIEWEVADTAGLDLAGVRAIRDHLSALVDGLLRDLAVERV